MRIRHFIRFMIHYATKHIFSMLRRLFLVFLSPLTVSISFANEAIWSCEQNKESKEWVCVGDKKPAAKTGETTVPAKTEPVKTMQPVVSEPAEIKAPVTAEPAQVTEPVKPEPAEIMQSVVPEEVPVTRQPVIKAEPVESAQPIAPAVVEDKQPLVAESVKGIQPGTLPASQKSALDDNRLSGEQARRPGWNCDANNEDGNWNCQLVGADPKGRAQVMAAEEPATGLLNPAFDHQQEQTFNTLTSQLKYDPWENCSIEPGTERDFVREAHLREVSPLDVKSNYSEIFENEIGSYFGNVEMTRADQRASSNTAHYDSVSEVLDLHGDVYYSEDELALFSDTATLKLASDQAKLRDVQFIAPTAPLRGQANVVYRDSKSFSRYTKVAFTSCRPGNQDWVVHASELKLNKVSGRGAAKNAWLEFKSVPVFYSPYLSFPIDNRRLSGFLAPSFGSTQNSGFNLSAPYYWNIAPNYDATLIPRYLTKRGPLLAGNFRYLFAQSKGNVALELMPNDSKLNKARYLGSVKNSTVFTPNLNSNLDLNYVSDKTYFAQLGNALNFPNYNFLRSTADVNYANQGVSFTSRVENYQSIGTIPIPNAALPYRKLPQINLNLDHAFQFMPLFTTMENEYVYFQHSDLVNGQRINTKPSVSVPLQTASSFFTPKVSLQHTQYLLSNQLQGTQTPNSVSRTLPIVSADSGLFFERNLDIANTPFLHTLEPRLFYLYVPFRDQQDIPLFDSAQYDFQFNSMFRENSFSGTDRIQDANQITTALTSRLVDDKAGLERLKLSVGEIFYFRDRLVTAPGSPIQTGSFSNLVTELNSELTEHLSVTSGLQWSPQRNDIERGQAALHFSNPSNEIFNIGYIYRKNPLIPDRSNDIINSDVSFRWPIYDNWYAMGRWQYSLLYNTTQDSFFGLEKENCCWRFRVVGRHYINNLNSNTNTVFNNANLAPTGTAQNGIFFQIELKGLTGIGEDLDKFFEQAIYGYRKQK